MNENEFENVTSETEETVTEEVVETVEENEVMEDAAEDVVEETSEQVDEDVNEEDETVEFEVGEEAIVEEIITEKKKSKTPAIISAIVIVVIALIAFIVYDAIGGNKYNKMGYANPNGRTVADVIGELGITLDEFIANYSLPEDITPDTDEMAAYYMIPVRVFSQMYGIDYNTFKEAYKIPDETTPSEPTTIIGKIKALFGVYDIQPIDENTPWGVVLDELTLGNYVGEENLESFKEYYGITEEITAETKYKEIRNCVDEKEAELAAEAKAQEEAAANDAENVEEPEVTDDTQTEATAE